MTKKVIKSTTPKSKSPKIKSETNNNLGEFLVQETVQKQVKPKGKSEVKTNPNHSGKIEAEFTKEKLLELGFEIELLPSGSKTNLFNKVNFTVNGLRSMATRGGYIHTVFYAPPQMYSYIKNIEFV